MCVVSRVMGVQIVVIFLAVQHKHKALRCLVLQDAVTGS